MNKRKKIIIITAVIISIILIIVGTVCLILGNNQEEEKIIEAQEENGESRLIAIRDKMLETKNYYVSLTLNEDNKKVVIKNDKQAKVITLDEGEKNTYIIKDNNTYVLSDNSKTVSEYKNSIALLNDFTNRIDKVLAKKYAIGKENIEGKEYRYEEFEQTSAFIINYKRNIDESTTKTRIYFEGNNIKYIKTYVGEIEQLLKVEMNFDDQSNNDFSIPEEYSK